MQDSYGLDAGLDAHFPEAMPCLGSGSRSPSFIRRELPPLKLPFAHLQGGNDRLRFTSKRVMPPNT
jgi:hypothetical protein